MSAIGRGSLPRRQAIARSIRGRSGLQGGRGLGDLPGAALRAAGRAWHQGRPGRRRCPVHREQADNSNETQASNIEALLAADIDVLVLNSVNPEAALAPLQTALDAGIPVIAYDRELESDKVLFLTHDNVLVGRMIADEVTKVQPTGNYAIIKGDETQTNPKFLREGMEEILEPLTDSGEITIVAPRSSPTSGPRRTRRPTWRTSSPPTHDIQAVLSENDNMATGVRGARGSGRRRSRSAARMVTRRPQPRGPRHPGRQRLEGRDRARRSSRQGRP